METLETDIMALSGSQTSANTNSINGAEHRFCGSGTNEVITVADFAKARYALKKANVPDRNLIAIVDPSVEYQMNTLTNISNISNNPKTEFKTVQPHRANVGAEKFRIFGNKGEIR